ncbi:hydrophobin 2 [Armillaria nabsnona]|nr:hydrophobin 2 [Armillaria nabsnona]
MFSRAFAATVVMIATLTTSVMSAPATATDQCNSGSLQCCNTKNASTFLGLTGLIGDQCSPLSVVGLLPSGAECTQQTVCCKDNSANALVANNCSPINIGL